MKRVVVLGASGHAKVVAFVLRLSGYEVVGFLDDDPALHGAVVMGLPVLGANDLVSRLDMDGAIVGIGDNPSRRTWFEQLRGWGIPLVNAIHPSAIIAQGVALGQGTAVLGNVSINVEAQVGDNVILNTGAIVGHDCTVASHVHVGPGVILCGRVRIGEGVFLGAGAVVIPEQEVGAGSIIGAGTVVISSIPAGVVAVGSPARILRPVL